MPATDGGRTVGGAVVHENDLHGLQRLTAQTRQALVQVLLDVVHGHDDADQWWRGKTSRHRTGGALSTGRQVPECRSDDEPAVLAPVHAVELLLLGYDHVIRSTRPEATRLRPPCRSRADTGHRMER